MKTHTVMGNSKKVTMLCNSEQLTVVGNHCIVRVTKNTGYIEVVGNYCKIEVEENYGSVSVTGSNDVVIIRRRGKGDIVQLTGTSCRLLVDGVDRSSGNYDAQISPFTATLDAIFDPIFNFAR